MLVLHDLWLLLRGLLSGGHLSLLGQHLVNGDETEVDLVRTDLSLLRMLALHVGHQAGLRSELAHAGEALKDGRHCLHTTCHIVVIGAQLLLGMRWFMTSNIATARRVLWHHHVIVYSSPAV